VLSPSKVTLGTASGPTSIYAAHAFPYKTSPGTYPQQLKTDAEGAFHALRSGSGLVKCQSSQPLGESCRDGQPYPTARRLGRFDGTHGNPSPLRPSSTYIRLHGAGRFEAHWRGGLAGFKAVEYEQEWESDNAWTPMQHKSLENYQVGYFRSEICQLVSCKALTMAIIHHPNKLRSNGGIIAIHR